MKTIYKVLICFGIGICFIFVGLSIGGLSELSETGFLRNIHFHWNPKEISSRDFVASDSIDQLEVNVNKGNVHFYKSSDIDEIRVTAHQIYSGFDIYQKGDKIIVEQPHYWWGNHQYEKAQIDIYVPENIHLETVKVNMSAGYLTLNDLKAEEVKLDIAAGRLKVNELECEQLKLNTAMGQTTIQGLTVHKKANVDVGAGDIELHLKGHESDYNTSVSVGLGHVRVGNNSFSGIADRDSNDTDGKIKLDIDCGLGNVNVEMEDL